MKALRFLTVFATASFASGCTVTSASYTPLNPAPRILVARSPEQVELFSSGPPARPHVDVGLITVEEGELDVGSPDGLIQMLRSTAAEKGCDGLVIAPPGSKSESPLLSDRTNSYKVYSGTCIVYRISAR
jgi:hypothetical protein